MSSTLSLSCCLTRSLAAQELFCLFCCSATVPLKILSNSVCDVAGTVCSSAVFFLAEKCPIHLYFVLSNKASQSCSSLPPLAGLSVVSDRHREPFYFLTSLDDHVTISTGAQYYTFHTVHSALQALHTPEDIHLDV